MAHVNVDGSPVPPAARYRSRILLVLVLVLVVLPLSGCEEDNTITDEQYQTTEEEYIIITLAAPVVNKRATGSGDVWDVTLDITDINPNTAMVPWIEVRVSVKGADGSMLVTATVPSQDNGLPGTEPEAWFQEISGNTERASVGDALRVTSMDRTFEGATFQVTRQGEVLATATIPSTFW